ncbi:MAG: transposase [Prevotella sp.]|nr:transposase [Candidatus Prevotella equi]
MIAYKYKLYRTDKTKHLDKMLREASFVWNHALALQKRYYQLYHKYIGIGRMKAHFVKHIDRCLLHSQTVQEILERLDEAYMRFFKHLAVRPPKFKKAKHFSSFLFKQGGFKLDGNKIRINKISKTYKFSLSREYEGKIKQIMIKRSHLNEFYIFIVTNATPKPYEKSHNGASVGIDFGLKSYMTMSDGSTIQSPCYLKYDLPRIQSKSRKLSRSKKASNNHERRRLDLNRQYERIVNKRSDWQWKLAHDLCRKYDFIFIEDLSLNGMTKMWGRKMSDLAHGEFVNKLEYVAGKYGVTVHKIDRFFPSSKTCTCGYVNKELTLRDRHWTCPECGTRHHRDELAASNILRQGIAELESGRKTTCRPKTA